MKYFINGIEGREALLDHMTGKSHHAILIRVIGPNSVSWVVVGRVEEPPKENFGQPKILEIENGKRKLIRQGKNNKYIRKKT